MIRVPVRLPGRRHEIVIGPGALADASRLIAGATPARRLLIITDSRVWNLHGRAIRKALGSQFHTSIVEVRPGERNKSLRQAGLLYRACQENRLGRDGAIIAVGGGMIGDLAGFVAATWQRGVDLVMMPTSLLAQVDSSVGGKVAVNVGGIKNLVGSYHQPRLVLADSTWLETLPIRERRSGLAEVVKYGMIADRRLFDRLERAGANLLEWSPLLLSSIVAACTRIKARIVVADERESGGRVLLNYGHTIGHAFEGVAAGRLRHGEAVALGMRGAASLAEGEGWLSPGDRLRQDALLDELGLPARFPGVDIGKLLANIKQDKKVRDQLPRFVLTRGIGSASLAPPIDASRVRRVLADLTNS